MSNDNVYVHKLFIQKLSISALTQSDVSWELVLVDLSEHTIERPEKNSAGTTVSKGKGSR
jgi:hypothetical protein